MVQESKTFGRTELAQVYFPRLCPEAAWHKLRSWLMFNPRLTHLCELRRRTFTPAEVQLIYAEYLTYVLSISETHHNTQKNKITKSLID